MSNTHDTYLQALEVAAGALDALAETKLAKARALDMGAVGQDAYNADLHTQATGEFVGACDALDVVRTMIRDYRKAVA